jgi:predicted ATPase
MLKKLRIQGFKSIRDLTIDFAPLTVLFGPNTAGKSNILEAVQLLSRLATEKTIADAFSSPLRGYPNEAFALPKEGLKGLLRQKSAELSLSADIEVAEASNGRRVRDLHYSATIRIRPQTGELAVENEFLARLNAKGQVAQSPGPRIVKEESYLSVRRLGEPGRPRHEAIGLNHTLLSNRQFSGDQYSDFDLLRDELASWRSYYLDPRLSMRSEQAPREVVDIGTMGNDIAPFLFRLKHSEHYARNFNAVVRATKAAIPSIDSIDVDLDERRGTLDVQIVQEGTPFSSRVISEGTLRVLALCSLAANPWRSSLIAFEEPENGVHPRRIEVIANLLFSIASGPSRQVIVTTHSPTLVESLCGKREVHPGQVKLVRCSRAGAETTAADFAPAGPLFDNEDIRKSLQSGDERGAIIEAALLRGWFDG